MRATANSFGGGATRGMKLQGVLLVSGGGGVALARKAWVGGSDLPSAGLGTILPKPGRGAPAATPAPSGFPDLLVPAPRTPACVRGRGCVHVLVLFSSPEVSYALPE